MKTAIIVSLNFHPGHVSHLVASYRQLEELGYKSVFCVNEAFVPYLPKGSNISVYGKDKLDKISIALFVFPSQKNLCLIHRLKREGTKIVYIFHEPLSPLKDYRKAGFSYLYLIKLWIINQISSLTVKWSDAVILPSLKAVEFYKANPLYTNPNIHYLPLMYDDEREKEHVEAERKYFGYIGTIAADHSFQEYLQFIEWAINNNALPDLGFLVATKSQFEVPDALKGNPRLFVQAGRPLSDEEINHFYAQTAVVWNAYERTTQSGVLAKSFMFGTPALILKRNSNEFTEDGVEVRAINDNTDINEILNAVECIRKDISNYSDNCRKRFLSSFYYRNYNDSFSNILEDINHK